MERVRWGVLSTARIARKRLLQAMAASHNGVIRGIASRDEARAAALAAEWGPEVRAYGSYEAILADPEIDAIYNPLPNGLHHPWTIAALQAGKHVLCEKPMALSLGEVDEMIAVAEQTGQLLMEAFMYRFHPRIERLFELVAAGTLGELHAVRAAFGFPLSDSGNVRLMPDQGGGALMDVGCYCVNLARTVAALTGSGEPAMALASGEFVGGVDVSLGGLLHFPEGVLAHFDASLRTDFGQWVELAGSEGTIRVEGAFSMSEPPTLPLQLFRQGHLVSEESFPNPDQWQLMVEHFAEAVLGRAALRYPITESRGNMATIEALLTSAREGRAVPVTR